MKQKALNIRFKFQITVKVLLRKYKPNGEIEFDQSILIDQQK